MRYAWIAEHGKSFALSEMCEVLDVSVSGYWAWKLGGIADRKRLTDAQMLALIRAIQAETKGGRRKTEGSSECYLGLELTTEILALRFTHYLPIFKASCHLNSLFKNLGPLYRSRWNGACTSLLASIVGI